MISLPVCLCLILGAAGAPSDIPLPNGRIVGGVDTEITQVPYQLALEFNGHQFCAATIISPDYAISAGHCVQGFLPESIQVRTGSTNRESGGKLIAVKDIVCSPKYNRSHIDYDVALIQLASSIEFDLNSQPVSLTEVEPSAGSKAIVSGWGSLQERGDAPQHLQSLQISIIDRGMCKNLYEKVEVITERMICAGSPGFDSCKGDSGGPIVIGEELVGIVSWGKGCGREGYPGVYTNIANPEVREFVRNVTGL